jgi:hypothetical protein
MESQIIPNWSDIEGTVYKFDSENIPPGFCTVTIGLREVKDVEGFRNLAKESVGQNIEVRVPLTLIQEKGVAIDNRVRCRIRKATARVFYMHPDSLVLI